MDTQRKMCSLLLLPVLLLVYAYPSQACPSQHDDLYCVNDDNNNITCVWNSTRVSDHKDTCTLHAATIADEDTMTRYSNSCNLQPVGGSSSALRRCSLVIIGGGRRKHVFKSHDTFSIKLSCEPLNLILINIKYKPSCHVKLNPPERPHINFTTISISRWAPKVGRTTRINTYDFQLQWKKEAESWKIFSGRNKTAEKCDPACQVELEPESLLLGQRYEARVRVRANQKPYRSIWSDWSPTASWVSDAGITTPPPSPTTDGPGLPGWDTPVPTIVGAAVALFLVVVFFRTDRSFWVYLVKKITGPPLPTPAKSFLHDADFKYTNKSLHCPLNQEDIAPIEVTNMVDAVTPCRPEAALLDRRRWDSSSQSDRSNYSNHSYSHLCTPPLSSLTGGNLEPCAADSPYGPVGGRSEGVNGEQDREEESGIDVEMPLLFSGGVSGGVMQVCSDYERVEKLQAQRCGVQSPDSGMGSAEEQVSQDSLEEAEGMDVAGGHGEAREEEHGKEIKLQKLFAGCGGIFIKGSIQVCSDYERVGQVQTQQRPGLQSPDSCMGSGEEEQVSSDSLEDASGLVTAKAFPFPPPTTSTSQCFLPSFTPLPLTLSAAGMSSPLGPLPGHILEEMALTPATRPIEPSAGGYMPVGEAQS